MALFPAKKSLGQHFLTDPNAVAAIVTAAQLRDGEVVLEIGPGTGVLTEALLATGASVVALEADGRAVAALQSRFARELEEGRLTLHHADVREVPPDTYVHTPYVLVANIPYYLTGKIIRDTLTAAHQPERAVLLVQKEVAERIARSEKESLLSLSVKAYGTPRYVRSVRRGSFAPTPSVDSAILAIEDISRARFSELDEAWFFRVLKAGFSSRRKQLVGNLTVLAPRTTLTATLDELGIPLDARGEDLGIATWCALAELLARA